MQNTISPLVFGLAINQVVYKPFFFCPFIKFQACNLVNRRAKIEKLIRFEMLHITNFTCRNWGNIICSKHAVNHYGLSLPSIESS